MHQQQLLQAKQAQEQQLAEQQQQAKLAQQQAMANVQEKASADAVKNVASTVVAPSSVGPTVGLAAQTAANGNPPAPAKISLANRICK